MFNDILLKLTKSLYPKGRGFRIPVGLDIEKYHKALAVSEDIAYTDALSILDSILPDNDNFTVEDAENWERRLGLITNDFVLLADRKISILRKIRHPGTIPARQHYLYIEGQLQAAGFDVYVHENRFFELGMWITKTPAEILGAGLSGSSTHSDLVQHGQVQHGGAFDEKIANSVDPAIDSTFNIGANFRSTFFIGGEILGTFASIDAPRLTEFRQLVLKLKPVQSVAFTFVGFTGPDFNNDFNIDFNI